MKKVLFVVVLILCATPYITAPIALLLGLVLSFTFGNPFISKTTKLTHKLLQYSVICLGFGMNAAQAFQSGKQGFLFTIAGILITFTCGFLLSKFFKVGSKSSFLISAGTAICGGSAIAAVAPIIKANDEEISVSLGVVFILNSIALFIFPMIGHFFDMTEHQFGMWAAIAIHDTSSVVGASSAFGKIALQTATTIKLTRALWIIPVSLVSAFIFNSDFKKIKIPYFIFVFVIAMLISTFIPYFSNIYHGLYFLGKQGLVITLFLIGSNLSLETVKKVGVKPVVLGVSLWVIISILSFISIY